MRRSGKNCPDTLTIFNIEPALPSTKFFKFAGDLEMKQAIYLSCLTSDGYAALNSYLHRSDCSATLLCLQCQGGVPEMGARSTEANFSNSKDGRSFYTLSYLYSNKEALQPLTLTDSTQVALKTTDGGDELHPVLQPRLSADPLYDKNRSPHVGKYPSR